MDMEMTSDFKWHKVDKKDVTTELECFFINIPSDSSISGQGCLEDPSCIKVTVSKPIYAQGYYEGHFWAFNRGVNVLSFMNDKVKSFEEAKNIIKYRVADIFNIEEI
jgi:hypothetical protein